METPSNHNSSVTATNTEEMSAVALYTATSRQLLDMILYDRDQEETLKGSAKIRSVGHKGLLEAVIRSNRYNANIDDEQADAEIAARRAAEAAEIAEEFASGDEEGAGDMLLAAPPADCDLTCVATSEEMQVVLEQARTNYRAAEKQMKDGLVQCEDWMGLRDRFYDSGAIFAVSGFPDEAAKCFLHATFINRAFKDDDEAVSSMGQTADNLKLAHPEIAVEVLVELAKCYEASKLIFQAARCRKEAAEILDGRMNRKERAIVQYKAAIETYEKTNKYGVHKSIAAACHERLSYLHTELGHYEIAEKLFLEHAKSIPAHLPATPFYMHATLAVLARGFGSDEKYFDCLYDTKKRFDALQEIDRGYQSGKENALMRRLLAAFDNNSLNEFDLALLEYNSFKTTIPNVCFDLVCARCRLNLFEHVERFE